jgi:serine/threonine protein kinase
MHRRKRLHELELRFYLRQLLQAIEYMHSRLVIHRDLKLGNLFLAQGMRLKVGDLGLAAQLDSPGEKRTTLCGTPNYIAPEIINKSSTGHSF